MTRRGIIKQCTSSSIRDIRRIRLLVTFAIRFLVSNRIHNRDTRTRIHSPPATHTHAHMYTHTYRDILSVAMIWYKAESKEHPERIELTNQPYFRIATQPNDERTYLLLFFI